MKNKHKKKDGTAAGEAADPAAAPRGTYEKAFLNPAASRERGSKCIYVSTEHHERLTRIVQVIGSDKIPLFAYLDSILEHHFTMFEQEITHEYNEKYKALF